MLTAPASTTHSTHLSRDPPDTASSRAATAESLAIPANVCSQPPASLSGPRRERDAKLPGRLAAVVSCRGAGGKRRGGRQTCRDSVHVIKTRSLRWSSPHRESQQQQTCASCLRKGGGATRKCWRKATELGAKGTVRWASAANSSYPPSSRDATTATLTHTCRGLVGACVGRARCLLARRDKGPA